MQNVVDQLKALGESNRFRIMMMLREKPLCVCEIKCILDISGSNLSNHLKILKYADLLGHRRDGKWVEYYLKDDSVRALLNGITENIEDYDQIDADKAKLVDVDRMVCTDHSS